DPSLAELVTGVRAAVAEAHGHQEAPLERVVEALQPDRSLGHNPLFQVEFTSAAEPSSLPRLPGLRVTPLDLGSRTAKFDLSMALEPSAGGGAVGRLEFARDLFDGATAVRICGHYRRLVAGALARPDARLSALPLLGADERRRVVGAWGPGV